MHYSLGFMSYPIKIIFLSAKLLIAMPITLLFRAIKRKKGGALLGYSFRELLVSVAIFIGIVMVLLPNDKNKLVQTSDIKTPDIQTPDMQTPDIQTPDVQNPDIQTPDIQTPDIQTPDIQTPDMQTPDVQNPVLLLRNAITFQWKGLALLILSINLGCVFDEIQTLMMHEQDSAGGTPESSVVLSWNMLSCVVFLALAMTLHGLLQDVVKLVVEDRRIVLFTVFLGVVNVLVQIVMISLKKSYGTWWKNIISALAKCCAIISSVVFFRHDVTLIQVVGIVSVFACVVYAGQIELNRTKINAPKEDGKEKGESKEGDVGHTEGKKRKKRKGSKKPPSNPVQEV